METIDRELLTQPYWSGHRERLRMRMELEGWDALKPHEMIEIILCYAIPQQDMSAEARALMDRYGTVGAVFSAPARELAKVPGVTWRMARWLELTGRLVFAYQREAFGERVRLFRYCDVVNYLSRNCRHVPAPQTWVLYTDFAGNLLYRSALCPTLAWFEPEYARTMVSDAISLQAHALILVLFVGDLPLTPEPEDLDHLSAIACTLTAIEVSLLDCVLVGSNGYYGMNTGGDLTPVILESGQLALHERYREADETEG